MPTRCALPQARRSLLALIAAIAVASPALAQNDTSRQLTTANGLLNRGHYELAVPEYEAYLRTDPNRDSERIARYGLGVCLFRLGRYDDAATELQRIADDDAFQFAPETRLILGHCLLSTGNLDEAIDRFRQIVRTNANHDAADDAAALLAESLYRAKRYQDALNAAEQLESRWPDSPRRPRAELIGAMSLMAMQRHADAIVILEPLTRSSDTTSADHAALLHAQCLHQLGNDRDALRAYESIASERQSPYVADALLGAAQVQHAVGRLDRARQILDQLQRQYAKSPTATGATLLSARVSLDDGDVDQARRQLTSLERSKDASVHDDAAYWLAKCDLRDGDPEDAAARLETAIQRWPKSTLQAEMRYDLGVALTRAGDDADAYEAFEQFRAAHPRHALAPDALHTMASIRHRAGEHEQCLALCEQFARAYPDHGASSDVLFLAGESEFLLGRHDAAADRFASLDADGELALLATLRQGLALDRLGNFNEAEPLLRAAADSQDPRCAPASLALGQGYFDQGRWQESEAYLRRYLQTDPDNADAAHLRLGIAQLRDDRPEDALTTLDELLSSRPDDETRLHAQFERAQALFALDRTDEARVAFEQVLDADDDSRFAPHALERLGAIALASGDSERAGDFYARAADLSPDDSMAARASFQQIQSLVASGEHAAAAEQAATFAETFPNHDMASTARVLQGVSLSRLQQWDDALTAFSQVRRPNALSVSMHDTLTYETAFALRESGQLDEAVRQYRDVVANGASAELRARALLDLASIDMDRDRYEDAITSLAQIRDMNELVALPEDVLEAATYRYAVCAQQTGRHEDAVGALAAFHARWTDSTLVPSASLICGESLVQLGRHSDARAHLQRAVEQADAEDIQAPALLRLGQCQAALMMWVDSQSSFERYLREHGDSPLAFQARFGLGWAIENQGRPQEAMTHYQQVVDTHNGPTGARAQFQIGECLFTMGDHEQAVRELLRVDILYDYPEWSAAALYEAGRCFEAMGSQDKAREQYAQANERFPESDWAAMASKRLDALAPATLPGRGDEE